MWALYVGLYVQLSYSFTTYNDHIIPKQIQNSYGCVKKGVLVQISVCFNNIWCYGKIYVGLWQWNCPTCRPTSSYSFLTSQRGIARGAGGLELPQFPPQSTPPGTPQIKLHFVQGSMESCHFESWTAPLSPPCHTHFEKSGYAPGLTLV